MPTTVTKTVQSSGGDYTSLSGWEAGEAADLVAADEIREAECHNFADSTNVSTQGFTTDATRYFRIFAADNHNGLFSTSVYRLENTSKDHFKIKDATTYARIEGIQFSLGSGATAIRDIVKTENTGGQTIFDKCIIVNNATNPGESGRDLNALYFKNAIADNIAVNCIIYDWKDTTGNGGFGINFKDANAYNCTVFNCDTGYNVSSDTPVVKNCVANDCTDGFAGTWDGASTNNASDISSDAPGGDPQTGNVTFVDEGADDFHLDSSDTVCKGNGIDLSGDSLWAFTNDIDGGTRGDTWDIGAHQVTGAGEPEPEAPARRVMVIT